MKHFFVFNPAAGNGKAQKAILPDILAAVKNKGADYEIHRTSGPGEATAYVRNRLDANPDEVVRFYSCGGDGTAAEVLNGLYGKKNAELAIIPAGSGNDYIRNFASGERFHDIDAQLSGEAAPVDVIRYAFAPANTKDEAAAEETLYAINMINMGFDARAVGQMERVKNKLFIKGKGAYIIGVLIELIGYKKGRAVFRPEGPGGACEFETDILLAGCGSGRFSGGGFDGIPGALVNDGLFDLMVIEPLTRREFIGHIGAYHDGKHINDPHLKDRIKIMRVNSVVVEPRGGLIFTADGEVKYTNKPIRVSVAPEKVNFVIPEGVKLPD